MDQIPGDNVVLDVSGLTYRTRSGKTLVNQISLKLRAKEIMVVTGPNGAGKSTLLRLMAGLLPSSNGSISLLGRSLTEMPPMERARCISVVGQLDQPDGRLTVKDYVALGRIPHSAFSTPDKDQHLVGRSMAKTGIAGLETQPLGALSGGELQRAHIARALCQEPKILFLDEPTNHLDPRARGEILSLIADIGISIIAVLHDLSIVPLFATSVAVMNKAHLVTWGDPSKALSADTVRKVFDVDLLRIDHPTENRELTVLDIPFINSTKH